MSIQIQIDHLEGEAANYAPSAYFVVSDGQGPPRITHVLPAFVDGHIVVSAGSTSAAAIAANPAVVVLWPATRDQSMSLIVDGEVDGAYPAEGGEIRIRPTGAVRHRHPNSIK